MSLWTPYRDEALDLTRKDVPSLSTAVPELTQLQYGYPYPYLPCYPPYCQQPQVRLTQISPFSTSDSGTHSPAASISPGLDSYNENLEENAEFKAFERDALQAMAEKNGGSILGSNPRMRRAVQTSSVADGTYRQQRERNNAAAKQSRDRRKLREFRLSLEVTFLKKKVGQLKQKLASRTCGRCE